MQYLIKGLIALGILVTGMLATVVIVVSTVDLNAYRDEISAIAEHSTGRRLTIEGDIDKRILTLSPRIVVNRVSFGNALWGSRPEMITAQRVELVLDLLPLLTGTLSVKRIDIVGADMLLETDPKGIANWELSGDAVEPASRLDPRAVPTVKNLRISGSVLTYIDGKTKLKTVVRIDRAQARTSTYGSGVDLVTLGAYNGTEINGTGRLGSIRSFLSRSKDFPVELDYRYGNSRIGATLTADLSGRVPKIAGEIRSDRLDLDELRSAGGAPGGGAGSGREEFGVGALNAVKADIVLRATQVVAGGRVFSDVAATLKLAKGDLLVEPFSAGLAGGRITGTVRFDAGTALPKLALEMAGRDLSVGEVTGTRLLSAQMRFDIQLSGAGRSMNALVASLDGHVVAESGTGRIEGDVARMLSADILKAVPFGNGGADGMALNCIVMRFDVTQGIGRSRVLVADTARFTVIGRGVVDLPRESVDLLFVSTTKGTSIASLAALIPVRVQGALRAPQVAPDPGGTAREAAAALIRLTDIPLDVVGSLFGRERRAARGGSPCPRARAQAEGASQADGDSAAGNRGLLDRFNPLGR